MANNDINRLIDMLCEKIEEAKSPALKPNMRIVDNNEMLDLLDELRAQLPVELKQAQDLMETRDRFIETAKQKAEKMIRQAELEAKTKVSESEILYAAKYGHTIVESNKSVMLLITKGSKLIVK